MAIKTLLDGGTVELIGGDNTLFDFSTLTDVDRYAVTGCSFYNTTLNNVTVEVYRSPDTTSAAGVRLDRIVLPALTQQDCGGLIGLSPGTDNIIVTSTQVGVNATTALITFGSGE